RGPPVIPEAEPGPRAGARLSGTCPEDGARRSSRLTALVLALRRLAGMTGATVSLQLKQKGAPAFCRRAPADWPAERLVERFLEILGGAELGHHRGLQHHLGAGLRVAGLAGGALGHLERAESGDAHLLALLHAGLNVADHGVHGFAGLLLGKLGRSSDGVDQI